MGVPFIRAIHTSENRYKGQYGTPSHIPVSYLSSDEARVASDRGPASSCCPRVWRHVHGSGLAIMQSCRIDRVERL